MASDLFDLTLVPPLRVALPLRSRVKKNLLSIFGDCKDGVVLLKSESINRLWSLILELPKESSAVLFSSVPKSLGTLPNVPARSAESWHGNLQRLRLPVRVWVCWWGAHWDCMVGVNDECATMS